MLDIKTENARLALTARNGRTGEIIDRSNLSEIAIRSTEVNNFEKGDHFVVPQNCEIVKVPVGTGTSVAYCTSVETFGVDGKGKKTPKGVKTFYFSSLAKVVRSYSAKKEGEETTLVPGEFVKASGSASDLYKACSNMADGISAIEGKEIEVVDVKSVTTLPWADRSSNDPSKLQNTNVLTFNTVG